MDFRLDAWRIASPETRSFGADALSPVAAPAPSDSPIQAGVRAAPLSGDAHVDALLYWTAWDGSDLTYSFPTKASQYDDGFWQESEPDTFQPLTATYKAALRGAYEGAGDHYGSFASIFAMNLTEAAKPGAGDLRGGFSDITAPAHCYFPGGGAGGDGWYDKAYLDSIGQPDIGSYVYMALLHENGHALGLKHPHEAGGPGGVEDVNWDSQEFSVMSYKSFVGDTGGGYVIENGNYPQTLMMLDIAALQHLYGADFTTNDSDTTYRWNEATGQMSLNGKLAAAPMINRVFMTVWDGGGNDTYDMSNYSGGVSIDLRPGEWSITSQAQRAHLNFADFNNVARGNVANAMLYHGDLRSLIENGIGGDGKDSLIGNQGKNGLWGNAGNDLISGLEGKDALYGGAGRDKVNGGTDNDLIDGGLAADKLSGAGGNDTLVGGAGGDQLKGGAGADTFRYASLTDVAGDTIVDLADSADVIDLAGIDADSATTGDQAFTVVAAFSNHAGEAVLTFAGGVTYLSLDVNGDSAADATLMIDGDHHTFSGFAL